MSAYDRARERLLNFMRVPAAPEPPAGAPESVRIFRAGKNYFRLRLLRWAVAQLGAVFGIVVSVTLLAWFRAEFRAIHADAYAPMVTPAPALIVPSTPTKKPADLKRRAPRDKMRRDLHSLALRTPGWVIVLLEVVEAGGILLFLVQVPFTFAAMRLEFELHWYIVTDRSLRIRTGLLSLQESTMSFANLQQVEVQQGPLQRLLGLADVRVQSAGGGSGQRSEHRSEDLHTGIFHGVENATAIRDLILERLRKFRETGLGDPDEHHVPPAAEPAAPASGDAVSAASELLEEAKALRAQLGSA